MYFAATMAMMISTDIYRPDQWHDIFILIGTGAATLTGLVFVSMTINLSTITSDVVHRNRAASSVTGLTVVFLQCSFALLPGQGHRVIGTGLLILAAAAVTVFLYGIYKTVKSSTPTPTSSVYRTIGSVSLYSIEMAGSFYLVLGHIAGLYAAVTAVLANFIFTVSGAWLLLVSPIAKE